MSINLNIHWNISYISCRRMNDRLGSITMKRFSSTSMSFNVVIKGYTSAPGDIHPHSSEGDVT